MKHSMISTEKLPKYLHCLLIAWTNLGLTPSTIEQTKFEYSLLCKTFDKGLDKDDKKEGMFKRLKNIASKIKGENKKESEPIKIED